MKKTITGALIAFAVMIILSWISRDVYTINEILIGWISALAYASIAWKK